MVVVPSFKSVEVKRFLQVDIFPRETHKEACTKARRMVLKARQCSSIIHDIYLGIHAA